jgi:hypothetical protein
MGTATVKGGEKRLRAALSKMRSKSPAPLELLPTNPFEVAIAERLEALQARIDRLQTRVNWLLTFIVGAAVTNVVIALLK